MHEEENVKVRAVALAAAFLAMAGCSQTHVAGTRPSPSPGATTPAATSPAGSVDLHDAVRRWWRRSISTHVSPVFNQHVCALKQPADIWLLGGAVTRPLNPARPVTHRQCAVPADRPVLTPVYNELIGTDLPSPTDQLTPVPMDVRLDGRPLTPVRVDNPRPYRVQPVRYNDSVRPSNEWATDRGYWVLLPGLAPGRHLLVIRTPTLAERPYIDWTLTAS